MEIAPSTLLHLHELRQSKMPGSNEQVTDALYRLTDRLFRARSLGQIYAVALDEICRTLACSKASILRFDAAGVMRFVAWHGLSEAYRRAVDGHTPWTDGDANAQPIFIEDIHLSAEPVALKQTILAEGIQALAFIPLELDGRLVGKFMLYYEGAHVFADRERELAAAIARQLGYALDRNHAEGASRRLAALVESSGDAIVAKDLDGIITNWNKGAERLFGYSVDEIVGKSVTVLIPVDRQGEEPMILARIHAGEQIEAYETVRQHKDGHLIDISLTVSPIRDGSGRVIGASKIARDISDLRRAQEQQHLLLREMNHRVKNLFALITGIVGLNARSAATPAELAATVSEQLTALSRAHALTMSPASLLSGEAQKGTTLHALIEAILTPYDGKMLGGMRRFSISGDDCPLSVTAVTPVALLFHEFATNAAKYGSLSTEKGTVDVRCHQTNEEIVVRWKEAGGPRVTASGTEGFGSRLIDITVRQVGRLNRNWDVDGVMIELALLRSEIEPPTIEDSATRS